MKTKLIAVLLMTTIYSILRYLIFGDVSLHHLPVYLLNKSISMASLFFLFLAAWNHHQQRVDKKIFWGTASWHCAGLHILFSLALLSSGYYPKLFTLDKMNLAGELTVLLGILAAYTFWLVRTGSPTFTPGKMLQILGIFFVAGHLVAMGFTGWLKVSSWNGRLPPISLISFGFAVASLALFLNHKDKQLV